MPETTKGVFGGACNRTACQRPGAIFYNQSTRAYYCGRCSVLLNEANPDALALFASPLCIGPDHERHPHHAAASSPSPERPE